VDLDIRCEFMTKHEQGVKSSQCCDDLSRKTCVTAGSRTIRARKISRSISANAYGALSLRGSAG
jgi:hypothetical protein